jgi:hypothetical protein
MRYESNLYVELRMAKNVVVAYFAVHRRWRGENEETLQRQLGLRRGDEKRHHHNTSNMYYYRVNLFGRVNELEIPHETSRNPQRNCVTIRHIGCIVLSSPKFRATSHMHRP